MLSKLKIIEGIYININDYFYVDHRLFVGGSYLNLKGYDKLHFMISFIDYSNPRLSLAVIYSI